MGRRRCVAAAPRTSASSGTCSTTPTTGASACPGSLVSRYVRGWGRPGDTAVIALENGFPVGAAWFRVFGGDEPGYGFVDERTPELAIAVVPSKRGHGVGDELLQALIAKAQAAGYERLSLSVEPGNPARKLYERHGFAGRRRGRRGVDDGRVALARVGAASRAHR